MPGLAKGRFLAAFGKAVAHLRKARLPFLDQSPVEPPDFAVKEQVLTRPI